MKFHIPDMTCGHCASHISKAISAIDPNAQITVDLSAQTVAIESTANSDAFAAAVKDAGYSPRLQA